MTVVAGAADRTSSPSPVEHQVRTVRADNEVDHVRAAETVDLDGVEAELEVRDHDAAGEAVDDERAVAVDRRTITSSTEVAWTVTGVGRASPPIRRQIDV
jgi:hypothetical protein